MSTISAGEAIIMGFLFLWGVQMTIMWAATKSHLAALEAQREPHKT